MAVKEPTFQTEYFSLNKTGTEKVGDATLTRLHITDRFHRWRHRPMRLIFGGVTKVLERYLSHRPHLHFHHPKNHARRVIYFSPGVRHWAKFMPGGFATYPVHNPDVTHLSDGKKVDYMTRNLFRHATDAIGLRARAYAMTWYIYELFGKRKKPIKWLSIAAGTGQPTFDAARLFAVRPKVYLADVNSEILEFARTLAKKYGIDNDELSTMTLDIADDTAVKKTLRTIQPDIVEMMGLMEYLDDAAAVAVVKTIFPELASGATFIFTNMRTSHPELRVHKHAVGWPGVIQRSVEDVLTLLADAGVKAAQIDVLLPDDNVYAVYCIKKP